MRKEIEINGCVEIPCEITTDEFADAFIEWIESKGWHFGGGFNEIVDGYYINPDGTKGKFVLEDQRYATFSRSYPILYTVQSLFRKKKALAFASAFFNEIRLTASCIALL